MVTISYAITACNEHVELERLLDQLNRVIRPQDEIVLQLDTTATEEVKQVAEKYNIFTEYEYHRIFFPLNNDFASFKNNLKEHCTRQYIIFLDADEILSINLELSLPDILEMNQTIDLISVPRINLVEGITDEDIKMWGWRINEYSHINYPDYQLRIIRNRPALKWSGKVHEQITGAITTSVLPEGYEIVHSKTIEKQRKQNEFYSTI